MLTKTKIIVLEGTTELSNKQLIEQIIYAINIYLSGDFTLTQKPRVQVAQGGKSR